jgi:ParB family transcriptional regulator, chromosome partitioning protein
MAKSDEQRNALRGLATRGPLAAFSNTPKASTSGTLELPVLQLAPMPNQARTFFDPIKLEELAASIREHGVLQPLVVRILAGGWHEIVAGERRWRAAKLAGLETVPCVIRELTDHQARLVNATENLAREDLNPLEEVEAILEVLSLELNRSSQEVISVLHRMDNKARGKITHTGMGNEDEARIESIFERLNRAWPSFVRNNLRVLRLPSDVLEVVRAGKLEYTKAILIAQIKDDAKRAELLAEVLEQSLSKRQIEQRLTALKTKSELPAEAKHLEQELSRLMGTKVRLTGMDRGELRVKFSSLEELNRVLEVIGFQG